MSRRAAGPIAAWLLVALGVDLLVTRVLLRLAIFIPKDDALAAVVGLAARTGAVVETLVAILALVLLAAVLSVPVASLAARLGVSATAGVAAAGMAQLVTPVTPVVALAVAGLVVIAAYALAAAAVRGGGPGPMAPAVILMGASIALSAAARLSAAVGALTEAPWTVSLGATCDILGAGAFLAGAALIGIGGLRGSVADRGRRPRAILVGGLVAGLVGLFALAQPVTAQQILIWCLGLPSLVPPVVTAMVAGLAVTGLLALPPERRPAATGLGIVLLAGYGLSASSLLLAGLLGLAVTGHGLHAGWRVADSTIGQEPAAATRRREFALRS